MILERDIDGVPTNSLGVLIKLDILLFNFVIEAARLKFLFHFLSTALRFFSNSQSITFK